MHIFIYISLLLLNYMYMKAAVATCFVPHASKHIRMCKLYKCLCTHHVQSFLLPRRDCRLGMEPVAVHVLLPSGETVAQLMVNPEKPMLQMKTQIAGMEGKGSKEAKWAWGYDAPCSFPQHRSWNPQKQKPNGLFACILCAVICVWTFSGYWGPWLVCFAVAAGWMDEMGVDGCVGFLVESTQASKRGALKLRCSKVFPGFSN